MKPPELMENSRSLIGWMTRNRVTPNLLMVVFIAGGFFFASQIKQEIFPEFELDIVQVRVPYPGSSPEEVEQGIVLSVEEAIRGLEGIKEITAVASEGSGRVTAELLEGSDRQRIYQDIEQQVSVRDQMTDIIDVYINWLRSKLAFLLVSSHTMCTKLTQLW